MKQLFQSILLLILLFIDVSQSFHHKPHFIILPGFFNDQIDYINPLNKVAPITEQNIIILIKKILGTEFGIVQSLTSRGFSVDVVPIQRIEWLNILRAVFSKNFWTNSCKPSQLFEFYFKAVDESVRLTVEKNKKPVTLIGHSAGGWLVRGILADGKWAGSKTLSSELVIGLVTLGAPHLPPLIGAPDATRGALTYVDTTYPGAFLSNNKAESLYYISVAGTAVKGDIKAKEGSVMKFASGSYRQVTGGSIDSEEIVGDGVVPLSHAHLPDAEQITLDCFHSIQSDKWYGSDKVIDSWLPQVLKAHKKNLELRERELSRDLTTATLE